jgi:hypothetical protein
MAARRRARGWRNDKKTGNKNHKPPYPLTKSALLSRIQRDQARLAALEAVEEVVDPEEDNESPERDYAENRVVKFFWKQLGSPPDAAEWKGYHGVISLIRRRMGAGAPGIRTVERTLMRLVEDENDDLYSTPHGGGRKRELSEAEDLYVGLLLCEGHSQRSATFIINGERSAQRLPPVGKHVIEDAERRVQLIRRRRRSKKSGSSDLTCAWCKASLAFALEVQLRLRAGAELARRPVVGPTFNLERKCVPQGPLMVVCQPSDEWGILGETIKVQWPGFGWRGCLLRE